VWPPNDLFLQENDLWTSWVLALFIAHGGFAHVFQTDSILRTAPAWLLITAPFARLASGLQDPFVSQVGVPSAWWVVGPVYFSPILVFFCAADRWMEGIAWPRRVAVFMGAGIALIPSGYQGHPEDIVSVGCALYALHACRSDRAVAAGWWMGVALGFQLEAVLLVPICLAVLARKHWIGFAERAVIGPVVLLLVPFARAPRLTVERLLQLHYVVYPAWASPLTHWLPGSFSAVWDAIILLGAVAAGVWVATWKAVARDRLLWVVALVLALRLLEPFFLNYYLTVALAMVTVVASFRTWWRLVVCIVDVVFLTWWLWFPVDGSWLHWIGVVALFGVGLLLAGFGSSDSRVSDPVGLQARQPQIQ